MNAAMNQTLPVRSDCHDNSTSGFGYDGFFADLHGSDDLARRLGGDAGRRALAGGADQARGECEELIESPMTNRLMAIGLPVFAWAAFGAAFLKVELEPMTIALIGAAGAALVTAATVAMKWSRANITI